MVYGAALEKRSPIISERGFESHPLRGEVLEWSIRHAWRACVGFFPTVGSNPTLSANNKKSATFRNDVGAQSILPSKSVDLVGPSSQSNPQFIEAIIYRVVAHA